ncbi:MAG TPA: SDR family oxidoreductase [Afifellaceae bacterium]|nr:SDR family oxidoreductase [Afifellaceae bacterium]
MSERRLDRLDGQAAIVTGASSGIGAATAVELARAGAAVAVNYHSDEEGARRTLADIERVGGRGTVVQADVSDEAAVRRMFHVAEEAFGPIDIVVSNAGLQRDSAFAEMSLADWNTVIATNLTGGFLVAREAVRRFRAKGMRADVSCSLGKIVFNSSVHELIPWAGHVNYAASKGGLSLLMKSLAQEVAHEKIRVNSVAPGAIATDINKAEREEAGEAVLDLIPYERVGDPEDVARVICWLCSDASDYVVGHALFVDGGMALYPGFHGNG